jgi:hypothetical protein
MRLLLFHHVHDIVEALEDGVVDHNRGERHTSEEVESVQFILVEVDGDIGENSRGEEKEVQEGHDCNTRCLGHDVLRLSSGRLFLPAEHNTTTTMGMRVNSTGELFPGS